MGERGKYYLGGKLTGLNKPVREFPCETPEEVRARLPDDVDIVAFQCRNPVHRAPYELFTRALDAPNVGRTVWYWSTRPAARRSRATSPARSATRPTRC